MIKSKILLVLPYLAIVAFFTGIVYYQNTVIKKLSDRVTVLSADVGANAVVIEMQLETIRSMEEDTKLIMSEIGVMQRVIVRSNEENNRKRVEYDSYRGRLYEVSLQRPTLIERRANSAFSDIMQTIARETTHGGDDQ